LFQPADSQLPQQTAVLYGEQAESAACTGTGVARVLGGTFAAGGGGVGPCKPGCIGLWALTLSEGLRVWRLSGSCKRNAGRRAHKVHTKFFPVKQYSRY